MFTCCIPDVRPPKKQAGERAIKILSKICAFKKSVSVSREIKAACLWSDYWRGPRCHSRIPQKRNNFCFVFPCFKEGKNYGEASNFWWSNDSIFDWFIPFYCGIHIRVCGVPSNPQTSSQKSRPPLDSLMQVHETFF